MDEKQFLALPKDQREEFQRQLKAQNLYHGKIDGKSGDGVRTALRALADRQKVETEQRAKDEANARSDALKNKELEVKLLEAGGNKAKDDAAAEQTRLETERQKRWSDHASSGLGMAAQGAANTVPMALGTTAGWRLGQAINDKMDAAQSNRNEVLRGAAKDRLAGVTTRDGAREAVTRAGAMPQGSVIGRVASRMAPHTALGAFGIGKGMQMLSDDPETEFYPHQLDRAAGLGFIGSGIGMLKQGVSQASAPKVTPDAQALGIINSSQLRRGGLAGALSGETALPATTQPQAAMGAPELPEGAPQGSGAASPAPGTKAYMRDQAKALGIKATAAMSKGELAEALAKAMSDHGGKRTVGKRLPKVGGSGAAGALAAGLAYAATPDEAMAADGTTRGGMGEAATNAAVAGGIGAGVGKLAQALGPVSGMMSEASAPALVDSMTEDFGTAEARNTAARYLPGALRFGAVEDAYQMAQVPTPGARDDASMIARQRAEQAEAMPLANAAALEIPQGIPAPDASGVSPYGPAIEGRLRRMIQTGATPEQLTQFLNQAVR